MGTRRNFQRKTNGAESPLHVLPVASKLIDYTGHAWNGAYGVRPALVENATE